MQRTLPLIPARPALRAGRDFKVLELNGVTSEATQIYDPDFGGLLRAYRVLLEQWRLAFEIGAANRERGVRPASVGALIAGLRSWIRASGTDRPATESHATVEPMETP